MNNSEFKPKRTEVGRSSIKFFKPGELTAERDNSSGGEEIRMGHSPIDDEVRLSSHIQGLDLASEHISDSESRPSMSSDILVDSPVRESFADFKSISAMYSPVISATTRLSRPISTISPDIKRA